MPGETNPLPSNLHFQPCIPLPGPKGESGIRIRDASSIPIRQFERLLFCDCELRERAVRDYPILAGISV